MRDLRDLKDNGRGLLLKTLFKVTAVLAVVSASILIAISIVEWRAAESKFGGLDIDLANATFTQLDEIEEGRQIAIVKTDRGEFKVALFPEFAPNTVDNFIKTAESGFYDGTTIISGISGVYFIGGNPEDTTSLPHEITEHMWTFKGAVCAVSPNYDSSDVGNRLLFVNTIEYDEDTITQLEALKKDYGNEALIDNYIEHGGVLNFAGKYTVFGQVFEGMEVYEEICGISNDAEARTKFTEEVKIESIEITTYKK